MNIDLILLTGSEVEVLVDNQETGLKRDLSLRDELVVRDLSFRDELVVTCTVTDYGPNNEEEDCNDRDKKRLKIDLDKLPQSVIDDVTESIPDINEDVSGSAGDSVITVDNEDESLSNAILLDNYPYLNTFPDLELDPDDEAEENAEGDSQDLVNTSTATLKPDPDFSDLTFKETSELDLILYSDRTSSEYFPDPRHYNRDDHSVNLWEAES